MLLTIIIHCVFSVSSMLSDNTKIFGWPPISNRRSRASKKLPEIISIFLGGGGTLKLLNISKKVKKKEKKRRSYILPIHVTEI